MKILLQVDDVLRAKPSLVHDSDHRRWLHLVAMLMIVFGLVYGAVMGSYGGMRGAQMLYSAIKVPILLTATFVISLPSFFVINTLLGLRDDFAASLRALATTQAGLTIILASFAPFTALWYASVENYDAAIIFNLLMFGIASFTAQGLLRRFYRPLIQRNPHHRTMLWIWLGIYAFVGIQMAWVLRPFIGDPHAPTTFFRTEAWGNAYVEVAHTLLRLAGR